jgi:hypothetical protein
MNKEVWAKKKIEMWATGIFCPATALRPPYYPDLFRILSSNSG